jgi:formamidopyrimidine-DNA glycosylase
MPELPEVQAHAERLTRDYGGVALERFTPLSITAMKTFAPDPVLAQGQPLVGVSRRGKYLLLDFGTLTFAVHLMQGGRLKNDVKQSPRPPKGTLARWRFSDGRALVLTEAGHERRAGVWTDPEVELARLGPEALEVTPAGLAERFAAHPMRLHGFLRDQGCIAGLGRRLANEICHRAKLSPFAGTAKLKSDEIERLVAAIEGCIDDGLAFERTLTEMSMSKDRPSAVHHRVGEPCPVCGDTIRSVEYRAYTVAYCPTCQTAGKVLADNTTSKFLK